MTKLKKHPTIEKIVRWAEGQVVFNPERPQDGHYVCVKVDLSSDKTYSIEWYEVKENSKYKSSLTVLELYEFYQDKCVDGYKVISEL